MHGQVWAPCAGHSKLDIHVYAHTHGLIFSPHPQCLPESLLIITLNSLCQAGCWVRTREQMSFQNAAPLRLPLLSNRREAEEKGRGQALPSPQVEEGQVVGTGPSADCLPLCP